MNLDHETTGFKVHVNIIHHSAPRFYYCYYYYYRLVGVRIITVLISGYRYYLVYQRTCCPINICVQCAVGSRSICIREL